MDTEDLPKLSARGSSSNIARDRCLRGIKARKKTLGALSIAVFILLVFLGIGFLNQNFPVQSAQEDHAINKVQLPNFAVPHHYVLKLHPNITTLQISGEVTIKFLVTEQTNFILFHAKSLLIKESHLFEVSRENVSSERKVGKLQEHLENEQICLQLEDGQFFHQGRIYSLELLFESKLQQVWHDKRGLYRYSYFNQRNEESFLAATDFKPTYARSAFPCFDEPHLKATFDVVIVREQNYRSISNMAISNTDVFNTTDGMELWRDTFQTSVKMSTWSVSIAVIDSNYKNVGVTTKNNVTISAIVPSSLSEQVRFAVDTAAHLIDYYDAFFSFGYPLLKLDLVLIPGLKGAGTSSFGLITSKETSFLVDPLESTTAARQEVVVTLAQMLAQQWLGNLVTPKRWNDSWINEGFTSFVGILAADSLYNDWYMKEQFVLNTVQQALASDARAHQYYPDSYWSGRKSLGNVEESLPLKAACIFRLLDALVGRDAFQEGTSKFVNDYVFKTADAVDLTFLLINNTVGTLQQIMNSWLYQPGYPVVTFSSDNRSSTIHVVQERFLLDSKESGSQTVDNSHPTNISVGNETWYIPLAFVTDKNPNSLKLDDWMNTKDHEISLPHKPHWIKFNSNETGFYRAHYDEQLWASLLHILKDNPYILSSVDRASIIDDVFTLCWAGLVNASVPLELSRYLVKETEYIPWATALKHFRKWSQVLLLTQSHHLLMQYIGRTLESIYNIIDWSDTNSHLTKLLRNEILLMSVEANKEMAVKEVTTRFKNWMTKRTRVPPNLREVVYSGGIKFGGSNAWSHCWARFNSTLDYKEREILLRALSNANDPWILQKYLDISLQGECIRPVDVPIVLTAVSLNPTGRYLVWRHLRANWESYESISLKGFFTMDQLVDAVVSSFSTQFDYQQVVDHVYNTGCSGIAINQTLNSIQRNIRWMQSNEKIILERLLHFLR